MKVYCSGIGGIGLSAYASLMKNAGHAVSGSDRTQTALTDDLAAHGITLYFDQSGKLIPTDTELFVFSEAIPESSPERMKAQELGIRQISYPNAVGELANDYETLIAVCGTHGKSSTTAMAARLLMQTNKDPTVVVGTKMKELDGHNWRQGSKDLFVLEACEYRKSFHHYNPKIILLTNCDGDHFDFYPSKEDYQQAFIDFLAKLPADGIVITHMSDPDCAAVVRGIEQRVIDADTYPHIALGTPGEHMQQNAQLVLALADVLGIARPEAEKGVSGYAGSWRRLEEKGMYKGIPVIDDYGHHPKEIRATIQAVKSAHASKRLVCAFQPHTHDRTLKLYDDFTTSFEGVDILVITDVYDARHDIERETVDIDQFVNDIQRDSNVEVISGGSLEETEDLLRKTIIHHGDVLLCLGAGDITNLASSMVSDS